MSIFKKLQYILIYICGFALIGTTSLMSGELGWSGFKSWRFYIDTGLTYMAIICIIIATLLKIIDDFKEKDSEYTKANSEIKTFATTTYRPSLFSKYCDHTNKKRKITFLFSFYLFYSFVFYKQLSKQKSELLIYS